MYKSSVTPIIQTKEQLHHLGDLPAYLTVRVHFKPAQRLDAATRLEEVPDRALTLQGQGFIVLEKPEKRK